MAVTLFGGGVSDMRGSIGGTTFTRTKAGSISRQRVKPTNPQTTFQTDQRSILTELSQAWGQVLTQAQRDAWAVFGVNFPSTNKLGQAVILSGIQAFSRIGARLVSVGESYLANAPADQNVSELQTLTLTADIGAGDFAAGFTFVGDDSDDRLVLRLTPGLSPGLSNIANRLRQVGALVVASVSPEDIEALYVARFGALPQVGQKVVMRGHYLRVANGAVSSELQAYAIVVST